MKRIARGDAGAFRELSTTHLKSIVTFSYRLLWNHAEAEDVAQETFLRAWQHAGDYEPQAKVSTWLHRIARNLAIDRLRKQKTHGDQIIHDEERDAAPASRGPGQLLLSKATAISVQHALTQLPERQSTALSLCHEQGYSHPEIAEVLECSVEAVESLLSRGRTKLRELLTPTHETSP